MKCFSTFVLLVVTAVGMASSASAAIFNIDISPVGGAALNLGANPYSGDHAVGLAAANETAQPASLATGNEVGAGITYDDITALLTYDFAYGSDFGFVDLTGNFSAVHIHGSNGVGTVNFPAANGSSGVIHDLGANHTAGSSSNTGRVTGSVTLSALEAARLFDNELYLNIHSSTFGAGEIRGQLIAVPEPSSVLLIAAMFGAAGTIRRRRRAI